MLYPSHYKYTRQHQWVDVQGNIASIGITDYVQKVMGNIVFIELPEVGAGVKMGSEICTVEAQDRSLEIYSPLTGTITEINNAVQDDPELLNDEPHNEGWLVKIRFSNASELKNLMSSDSYEAYIRSEDVQL